MIPMPSLLRARLGRAPAALLLAAALGACEGSNLYEEFPTSPGRGDGSEPLVQIVEPDSGRRVAVLDSVLVGVRVADNRGLSTLELRGFSLRGSAELGTQTRVERFATKVVEFDSLTSVRDTTVTRYLLPAADTLPDARVYVVATATDRNGNQAADTLLLSIGGPRVQLVSPTPGTDLRAGTTVPVRVAASDPRGRVESLTVEAQGGGAQSVSLRLDPPALAVDTVIDFPIPAAAQGEMLLRAVVRSANNDSAISTPVQVRLLPPIRDQRPPTVTFRVDAPERVEQDDSVTITVSAVDSTQVARTGVTVVPIHRLPTATNTLTILSREVAGGEGRFRISLADLDLPLATDTSTLRLEVTAFAVDTAGNCATATVPATPLSEGCRTEGGHTFANRTGARTDLLVVRGHTIALADSGDVIADLVSDGERVFLSNLSRNRLEVVRVGELNISGTVSVGSRPWGLAFNRDNSRLYVANSGGTNISVVSPSALTETRRILTPNVKVFDVSYEARTYPNPAAASDSTAQDSLSGLFPSSVTVHDFSDRPQYIGVTRSENLIYSTLPTGAAPDGTVRVYRTAQDRLELVTEYAEKRPEGKLIILNADSAFLVEREPNNEIRVCPRPRSANPALDNALDRICVTGEIGAVASILAAQGYDTQFQFNRDIAEIGLQDTTFVAVSGDHSTVAVGEGGTPTNARVMVLRDPSDPNGALRKSGDIGDIVGNTAERVIGLALNADGTLGVARGREAYYFSPDLRLQGVVSTGQQSGGVDMHPRNPAVARSFVSGIEANGLAYIDVIDSFHFRRVARIYMRDPIVGAVRAVETATGYKVYAVTAKGVAVVDVQQRDL